MNSLNKYTPLNFFFVNLGIIEYDYKKWQCSVLIEMWTAEKGFQSLKSKK